MPSETPDASGAEPQLDWEALARFLAGEGSPAERASVQAWLARHSADARTVNALDDALRPLMLSGESTSGIDVEAALAAVNTKRFAAGLSAQSPHVLPFTAKTRQQGSSRRLLLWVSLAAAAVFILAIASTLSRRARPTDEAPVIASRTFTTGVGGRDSLVLYDGTTVVLGPRSRLALASGYGQSSRAVRLEGEAYFDVKHDARHPFSITANGAEIRDVGTSFAVHADSLGIVRVAVKSGAVELSRVEHRERSSAVLNAGDIGLLDTAGQVVARRGAVTEDDLAWTHGTLMFRDATIADVRDDLRRWYGIELVASESIMRRHLTATFNARDSITAVLRNIALSLPASIERRGDTAFIRPVPETRQRK